MQKIIKIVFLFFLLFYTPFAFADFSSVIPIADALSRRSVVIVHPQTQENYLLYLGTGCGDLLRGQKVTLTVRGELDASEDSIKTDNLHRCKIEQAEIFNQKLFVRSIAASNTSAHVEDEKGYLFYITYGPACAGLLGYRNLTVYALMGGSELAASDRLFLPDKAGQCSLDYVEKVKPSSDENPESKDHVPTQVTNVKAFPGNGKVYLSWRAAQDDRGVVRYEIGYTKDPINSEDVTPEDMSFKTTSTANQLTVKNLDNDQAYYFYVIAVDTAGQISSEWSDEVSATPKASISDVGVSSKGLSLNLRVARETKKSFWIEWDYLPQTDRQTVVFENKGKRELSYADYPKKSIRILKTDKRKGNKLRLTVRVYDVRGLLKEEWVEFGF